MPLLWRRLFRAMSFCCIALALLSLNLPAQETSNTETPTGTIQGSVKDTDGDPVEGARILFRSKTEGISTVVRTAADGAYVSEGLTPGDYLVRVQAKDLLIAETHVTVKVGAAVAADFK